MATWHCRALLVAGLLAASANAVRGQPAPMERVATPTYRSEVVLFEDNVLDAGPTARSLVYRREGTGVLERHAAPGGGRIVFARGPVSLIHPAQYDRATVRLRLRVDEGDIGIAVAHNGQHDIAGAPAEHVGVEVLFGGTDTRVVDLATGAALARIPRALPRRRTVAVSVAWDVADRSLRIDLPGGSFRTVLPTGALAPGGFAIRAHTLNPSRVTVERIQVLWEDQREVVLYDGYDGIYDEHGRAIGRIPPTALPEGQVGYSTNALDLVRERSLIVYGGADLNGDHPETIRGFAVRDLRTGRLLATFDRRINGCLPMQGGGGFDGLWLLQSWTVPASTCWLDWDAFDRGDLEGFVRPFQTAEQSGPALVGFHDPANALDGSLARYLRITESWRGVNHLTVHPALRRFFPVGDLALPDPPGALVSHTGPAGLPTQLAVRDRDRAWYELWAYRGHGLHVQCRGYNLFAVADDWQGPLYPAEPGTGPIEDWANLMPSLLHPGSLVAPRYRFDPRAEGAARVTLLGADWLTVGAHGFIPGEHIGTLAPGLVPYQILMDRGTLLPLP